MIDEIHRKKLDMSDEINHFSKEIINIYKWLTPKRNKSVLKRDKYEFRSGTAMVLCN